MDLAKLSLALQAGGAGLQGGDPGAVLQRHTDEQERIKRKAAVDAMLGTMGLSGPQQALIEAMPVDMAMQTAQGIFEERRALEEQKRREAVISARQGAAAAQKRKAQEAAMAAFQDYTKAQPSAAGPTIAAANQGLSRDAVAKALMDPRLTPEMRNQIMTAYQFQNPETPDPKDQLLTVGDTVLDVSNPQNPVPVFAPTPEAAEQPGFEEYNSANKDFRSDEAVKDFGKQARAYTRVIASGSDPSPAGDLALIFNYMKILDPGSVVRESEFATAANTGSVPQRIWAQYNRVLSGERLSDEQRADFMEQSERLYRGAEKDFDNIYEQYSNRAEKFGLDPNYALTDYRYAPQDVKTIAPPPAQPPAPAATPMADPIGNLQQNVQDLDDELKSLLDKYR